MLWERSFFPSQPVIIALLAATVKSDFQLSQAQQAHATRRKKPSRHRILKLTGIISMVSLPCSSLHSRANHAQTQFQCLQLTRSCLSRISQGLGSHEINKQLVFEPGLPGRNDFVLLPPANRANDQPLQSCFALSSQQRCGVSGDRGCWKKSQTTSRDV